VIDFGNTHTDIAGRRQEEPAMGKKKNKDKKTKIPKQVAGVKIPKAWREQGRHLADLARNPLVAEVAAAGLTAVAAALREGPQIKTAAAKARDAAVGVAEKPGAEAAQEIKTGLADLANVALAAATQGLQAFASAAREKPSEPKKDAAEKKGGTTH
jgi:hypothetical protein